MWVQDVRMPVQPSVPIVIRPDSGASTRMETFGVPAGLYETPTRRRRARSDADCLTDSDLDLIYAVTGETVWQGEVTGSSSARSPGRSPRIVAPGGSRRTSR